MGVILREGIYEGERAYPFGPPGIEHQRDRPAHGVADDMRLVDADGVHLLLEVLRADGNAPAPVEGRVAEAPMVERVAGEAVLERRDLMAPLVRETTEKVDQDNGRALAVLDVAEGFAVDGYPHLASGQSGP